MPEIGTSGSMSEDGNGALPHGPSYRAHPRLYPPFSGPRHPDCRIAPAWESVRGFPQLSSRNQCQNKIPHIPLICDRSSKASPTCRRRTSSALARSLKGCLRRQAASKDCAASSRLSNPNKPAVDFTT